MDPDGDGHLLPFLVSYCEHRCYNVLINNNSTSSNGQMDTKIQIYINKLLNFESVPKILVTSEALRSTQALSNR